jgi:hypothetical protein
VYVATANELQFVAIDFSESMQWFRFRTRARGTIRVSVYRTGLGTLAEIADGSPLPEPARDGIRMLREKASRHAWGRSAFVRPPGILCGLLFIQGVIWISKSKTSPMSGPRGFMPASSRP